VVGAHALTLEEARQRVLQNSQALQLAAENIQAKQFATRAARADYFPKVVGGLVYFHFNNTLGDVVTLGGRTLQGPAGRPILNLPVIAREAAVFQQDSQLSTVTAVQPITALLKVRQGVKIGQADERIAQAEYEKGARALVSGVEQLYLGLLAAQKLQAGAQAAVKGAEELARVASTLEVRTALVEARQGLQAIDNQVADLEEQLLVLLNLPACTKLTLTPAPLPTNVVACADAAVGLAMAASPEIRMVRDEIAKAEAATAAAKVDYLPNAILFGGYLNQTAASYVQQNIGYVGAGVTYDFIDWGKRRNVLHERQTFIAMANSKLRQTEADVRQKALKTYRELGQDAEALKNAQDLVALRQEAAQKATTPAARLQAAKDLMQAEVDLVKADLALRISHVQLAALLGNAGH
jgi:outer membrane protein TolC